MAKSFVAIPLKDGSTRKIDLSKINQEELSNLTLFLYRLKHAKQLLPLIGNLDPDFDVDATHEIVANYHVKSQVRQEKQREKERKENQKKRNEDLQKKKDKCWGNLADQWNKIPDFTKNRKTKIEFNVPISMEIEVEFPEFHCPDELNGRIVRIKVSKTDHIGNACLTIAQRKIIQEWIDDLTDYLFPMPLKHL